jgi:hypothetical protein
MKKIFTLAFSILMVSQLFAAAEFFVKINSTGNYTVSLNNQIITSPANTFRFFDLYAGTYNLRVVENVFNGRNVFDKPVTITNGYRTVAELDRFFGLRIIEKIPFIQSSWYVDHLQNYQYNQPGWGNQIPNGPKPTCGPTCNHPYGNHGWNNGFPNTNFPNGYPNNFPNNFPNNYPNNYPYGGGNFGYGNIMDDASLQTLIQTMKNITFEDKMLEVARTALKNTQVKTSQVHQLLQQFTFEQNKLEMAKYAYDRTIDKNNYYTLYNDFTFNNYSSQLDKYINSR